MPDIINTIISYVGNSSTIIVLLAAIFEWFVPYPYFIRLNRLLPGLATIGRRVNRYGHPKGQQVMAGILLPLLILFAFFALIIGEIWLSSSTKLTEIILLLLILESRPPRSVVCAINRYTASGQLNEAKMLLGRFTLRRTDKLSAMGIMKSAAEMCSLRLFYNFYVPIMLCLIFGNVYIAVAYRILLLCRMAFNIKLPFNQVFGSFSASLTSILEVIPTFIALLFGAIIPHRYPIQAALTQALNSWPSKTGGLFVAETAAAVNLKLGGPRYYLLALFRFPIIGGATEPEPNIVNRFITRASFTLWCAILASSGLIIAVTELLK